MIVAGFPPAVRYIAALTLLLFLPGWVWLQVFSYEELDQVERIVIAVGLSLALTIFGAMFAVYLPGSLSLGSLLGVINTIMVIGLIAAWQRNSPPVSTSLSSRILLIVFILIVIGAVLRLPRLGYAEFHEDEAETLMLGVRLLHGEDYALFLHRKGPAQMLVPVAFWLLTGRINESMARFPFAVSSILSIVTLFIIGRRWFNWQAGLIAALLWAANGYAIAFGRMVQYQALIFFLGPLAIYCLYLAWEHSQKRFYFLGAILMATSLLAHFDALLLLPATGYLGWLGLSRGAEGQRSRGAEEQRDRKTSFLSSLSGSHLISIGLALMLFLVLLGSFYIPFALDPEFKNTANYLAGSRVKPGLLYDNLDLLRRLDRDYSSHFYLLAVALGIFTYLGWLSIQLQKKWRWLIIGLVLLSASTFWRPTLWHIGQLHLAIAPWLLLLPVGFWQSEVKARIAWGMFGAAFVGYVFLVDDPRTHLYIIYPGAILLTGVGWSILLKYPSIRYLAWSIGGFLIVAIIVYTSAIFLQTETTFTQLRKDWDGSIWETIYNDIPTAREYFGYPKREGWKAIGALRAQGLFPGDFRSINEDFIIPIWYNYGQARSCYNTPAQFFARIDGLTIDSDISDQYHQSGQIQREGETRLQIFSAGASPMQKVNTYALEELEDAFDRLATPQHFMQQGQPSRVIGTQFGSAIQFVGYDLPTPTIAPGETLRLNLYWKALAEPGQDYRAFVHLTNGTTLWSQQDDNPACRLPTSIWRVGQKGIGQFRLPIDPETPPGRYSLIIGLYEANTLDRLKITAGSGQIGDDFLWLTDVEVVESN